MPPTGDGKRKMLVVAEAPGRQEDEERVQLIGESGQKLRDEMELLGWDLDEDCWKTNAVICRPVDNAKPTVKQLDACLPNLLKAVNEYKPEVVLLLGGPAVESVIGYLWKNGRGGITQWAGWQIPSIEWNCWVCPTYHPAYLIRTHDPVLELVFKQHLKAALSKLGRPYAGGVPDYQSQVELIYDHEKAAKVLRGMVKRGGLVAFDYETNMLKPDSKDADIVCCSVCWQGRRTIAFPLYLDAIDALKELLQSDLPKVGWNIKFEERWSQAVLGVGVRNWVYDGMVGTHTLDNRKGITGAKFQAFVRLGIGAYDLAVEPYLKASGGGNEKNKIKQVEMEDLLLYCGMDSLVEYKVDVMQMEELGIQWV